MNNQIPVPNTRYPQQQLATPQLAPPQLNQPNQFASIPNQAPVQMNHAPTANVQGIAAPSFDDLRQKFEQNSNANSISAAGNQLVNNLAVNVQSAKNQVANNLAAAVKPVEQKLNHLKQSLPDLSGAQSAVVQAVDQTRDEGLINALKSELGGDNDALPALSSANEPQSISIEAPAASTLETSPTLKLPTPAETPSGGNDFLPNLDAQMQELKADSEFTATPIGSANDSINSLASGHRSEMPELQVQQANIAPDSFSQTSPSMNLESA